MCQSRGKLSPAEFLPTFGRWGSCQTTGWRWLTRASSGLLRNWPGGPKMMFVPPRWRGFSSRDLEISTVYISIPVGPHKAVAEASNLGNRKRRGWLLWITDGRANPLMDWKVVGGKGVKIEVQMGLIWFLSFFWGWCLLFTTELRYAFHLNPTLLSEQGLAFGFYPSMLAEQSAQLFHLIFIIFPYFSSTSVASIRFWSAYCLFWLESGFHIASAGRHQAGLDPDLTHPKPL